jgi:hypothetical protein
LNNSTIDAILRSLFPGSPIVGGHRRFDFRYSCSQIECRAKMSALTIDNLFSNRKNLERILDNMKDGIIAHDLNRRIFTLTGRQKRLPDIAGKMSSAKIVTKRLGGPFCGSRCSFCDGSQPIFMDTAEYPLQDHQPRGSRAVWK